MIEQIEPIADLYTNGEIDRDVTFTFGKTVINWDNLRAVHKVYQDLKLKERDLKAELCEPLAKPRVGAPPGTILERKHTGTYRGRQLKGATK